MPKLRNGAELSVPLDELPNKIASSLTKGITEKKILTDKKNTFYIAKKPDEWTVNDVFTGYIPEKQDISVDTAAHIFSLQLERSFLEILIPRMAAKMFQGILAVPETYLHVDGENSIWVISKFMDGFSEFLASKEVAKASNLFEREYLPCRAELQLTSEEARIIGQLYAVALVFNLWDLLNSKLLNSGACVGAGKKRIAAIVDFGCSAHISYKGRHADTLVLNDPDFSPTKKMSYSFFGQNYREHYRHKYALPFDKWVAPLLPHIIVADLFNMSNNDAISIHMLEGFTQALATAETNMMLNPSLLDEALDEAYNGISQDSVIQVDTLKKHLNGEFFGISSKNSHTLIDVIQHRLLETKKLISKFKEGITAESIQEQVRDNYYYSQCY